MDTSAYDFENSDEAPIDAEIIEPANDSGEPTGIPDMPEDEAALPPVACVLLPIQRLQCQALMFRQIPTVYRFIGLRGRRVVAE